MNRSRPDGELNGRVVLITGAGSGFGQAMSKAFCAAGAQVFGVGRRTSKLEETARQAGSGFTSVTWDVTKTHQAREFVHEIASKAGRLDVLINNAAILIDDDDALSELPLEKWEKTWMTNVSAGLALTQAAFGPMREARYGRVANVTSGLGFFPMLEYGSYCISKAAVNMMTRVFALDGEKENILVNAIEPGVGRTEMNTHAADAPETVNAVALYLASLPSGGPSGKCFNKRLELVEW